MLLNAEAYEIADKGHCGNLMFSYVSIEMLGLDDQGYLKSSHTISIRNF